MAITVTDPTISSSYGNSIIGPGEQFNLTLTVKNSTGYKMTRLGVFGIYRTVNGVQYTVANESQINVSLANGKTGTFTLPMRTLAIGEVPATYYKNNLFSYMRESNTRSLSTFSLGFTAEYGSAQESFSVSASGIALDNRCMGEIAEFSMKRCDATALTPNDEGEKVLTTLRIRFRDEKWKSRFTMTLYQYTEAGVQVGGGAISNVPGYITGVKDALLFSGFSVPKTNGYTFRVTLTDGYETAVAVYSVARAFACMHLSPAKNGGVAFGRFSTSTDASPKLESDYPAFFYNGIMNVQAGTTDVLDFSNAYKDVEITFPTPFKQPPTVLSGFHSESTSNAFGRCCTAVVRDTLTATGCTIRVFNGSGTTIRPNLTWIAYGIV